MNKVPNSRAVHMLGISSTINTHQTPMRCFLRWASTGLSRQARVLQASSNARSVLSQAHAAHRLFNPTVHSVVDFGYSPGNWLLFARDALADCHHVTPEKCASVLSLVGVDKIHTTAPPGTFCTQGNIFSKNTHSNIVSILKDNAYRQFRERMEKTDGDRSPFDYVSGINHEEDLIGARLEWERVTSHRQWQADVVLSDLGPPFLQTYGFYANTISQPHIRSAVHLHLRDQHPVDLADAALVFCCDHLRRGGSFFVRLPLLVAADGLPDPDVVLFRARLRRMFANVHEWPARDVLLSDQYFLALGKADHVADKRMVFS